MQEVANLLLGQGLLYQEAEENGVPKFPARQSQHGVSRSYFKKVLYI
jgi:hypothetical protein